MATVCEVHAGDGRSDRTNRACRTGGSASGGSITNGVVAHEMDYRQASAADVRAGVRSLLRHIAYTGLFFWGPSTNLYVVTVLAIFGLGVLGFAAGLVMAFI